MEEILGDEFEDFTQALEKPAYQALYINTNKDQNDAISKKYNLIQHPYVNHGYYFDKSMIQMGKFPYHDAGLYYIQEPSAMLVAELADLKPGMRVLDLCAAPGGKACKAAIKIGDEGLLIANDISTPRAKILSENIERMGLKNTIVTNATSTQLAKVFHGFFDAIIVDAPCSGEGMFRKLDIAKETWSEAKVDECAAIQIELLNDACDMLKDGGILMYSTCTYEVKENEDQVRYALENLPFELVPLKAKPGLVNGINLEGTLRLYPHHFNGEGHFIAKMQKHQATEEKSIKQKKNNLNKEQMQLFKKFYQDTMNMPIPDGLYVSNEHLYALPYPYLDLEKVRILRNGLYLGQFKKNRFEPSLSLALAFECEDFKRVYNYQETDQEIAMYLHGDTFEGHQGNGFGVVAIEGHPLGFVKETSGILKNFYPKGLRKP